MKMEEAGVKPGTKGKKEKFVTVVSVDDDEETEREKDGRGKDPIYSSPRSSQSDIMNDHSDILGAEPKMKGRRPKPSPRQFVTVVSVGNSEKLKIDSNGTATLESNLKVRLDVPGIGEELRSSDELEGSSRVADETCDGQTPDQIVVFRLPGERLGLGLKFDGGMAATEKVRRLFIQSVAPDSPAARATVPWGDLEVGDQILHIEGCEVSSMTRVECVNRLKEASVKLTVGVLKGNGEIPDLDEVVPSLNSNSKKSSGNIAGFRAKRLPPPPLPPRSGSSRTPARPPKDHELPPPPQGFEDFDSNDQLGKSGFANYQRNYSDLFNDDLLNYMSSSHRHIARLPPAPEVYLDLLSEEDKACRARCESESDETNSSVSTVIDRLSISSSRTVSRNSSFNAVADGVKFDLSRALSPFEHLENEINMPPERRQRSLSTPHLTYNSSFSSKTQKTLERQPSLENGSNLLVSNKSSTKGRSKTAMKSFSFSLKSRPFSWHNTKLSSEEKSLKSENSISNDTKKSITSSNKRPAPLPPQISLSDRWPVSTIAESKDFSSTANDFEFKDISVEPEIDELQDVFTNDEVQIGVDDGSIEETLDSPKNTENHLIFNSGQSSSPESVVIVAETTDKELGNGIGKQQSLNLTAFTYSNCDQTFHNGLVKVISKDPIESECLLADVQTEFMHATELNEIDACEDNSLEMSFEYESHEPLDTETYESQPAFFINEVYNPSYGLSPLLEEQHSDSASSLQIDEMQEVLYEEIDGSRESENIPTLGSVARLLDTKPFDLCSLGSNFSVSSTSLSSREMEELRAEEDFEERSNSFIVNNKMYELAIETSNDNVSLKPFHENDYIDVDSQSDLSPAARFETEAPPTDIHSENIIPHSLYKTNQEISINCNTQANVSASYGKSFTHTSRDIRLRKDLCELLKKDLELGENSVVEIEEEELVESRVECENEEELLLVLRALRCDNSFTLEDPNERRLGEDNSTNDLVVADGASLKDQLNKYCNSTDGRATNERNVPHQSQVAFERSGQKDLVPSEEGVSDPVTCGPLPREGERNERGRSQIVNTKEQGGVLTSRAQFNPQCQSRIKTLPSVIENEEILDYVVSSSTRCSDRLNSSENRFSSTFQSSVSTKEGDGHASDTHLTSCKERVPGEQFRVNGGREAEEVFGEISNGSHPAKDVVVNHCSSSSQNSLEKREKTYLNFKDPKVLSSVLNPSGEVTDYPSRALRKYLKMVAQNHDSKSNCVPVCPDESLVIESQLQPKYVSSTSNTSDDLSHPVKISDVEITPPDLVPLSDLSHNVSGVFRANLDSQEEQNEYERKNIIKSVVECVKINDKSNDGKNSTLMTTQSPSDIRERRNSNCLEVIMDVKDETMAPSPPIGLDSHRTKKEKSVLEAASNTTSDTESSLQKVCNVKTLERDGDGLLSRVTECDSKAYHIQGGSANVNLFKQRCSNAESQSTPPSYSRLPPDGHEFPNTYSEGSQEARINQYTHPDENDGLSPTNGCSPSTLPRIPIAKGSPSPETRSLSRWRRQDERSEKSVRDKIAMFSSENKSLQKNRKINRSESVSSDSNERNSMKRSLTEDDVRIESATNGNDGMITKDPLDQGPPPSNTKLGKAPVYNSMVNVHSSDSESKENVKPASSETDIREKLSSEKSSKEFIGSQKSKSKTRQSENKGDCLSGLSNRSQSLIDIGRSSRMKRHSVGAYDRPSIYKYGVEKPEDKERRTSLNNMIEQRRKSMSKLRGLVIPETRIGEGNDQRLPIDLPKISSNTSSAMKTMSLPRDEAKMSRLYKADSVSSIDSCSSSASRHSGTVNSFSSNRIQKLSPANNRKSSLGTTKIDSLPPLSYRPNRNPSPMSDFSAPSSTPRTVSPQRSCERALTPSSDTSFEAESKHCSERINYKSNLTMKVSLDSRLSKSEDSDNDSAVSSTQSSFSQSLSPRASPMPDHYDPDDRHSPSRSSRSNHSPQSSYDELDTKRVLKNGTIEAENRRNILKSSKFSSGRSSDEQSTPEIVRKYSKESPSDSHTFPDRLDSELRDGPPKKVGLRREGSIESTTSISSHHSSLDSSRRNSRESVIHINRPEHKVSAEQVYFDRSGEMYKESQVKVAYLNEIVDDFVELSDNKENIVAEIPISSIEPLMSSSITKSSSVTTTNPKPSITTHVDTKWSALEQKYSKRTEHESFESKFQKYISPSSVTHPERNRSGVSSKKGDFRALADKWKQRVEEDPVPAQPNVTSVRRDSNSKTERVFKREGSVESNASPSLVSHTRAVRSFDESSYNSASNSPRFYEKEERPTSLDLPRADVPDRKFSVPEYSSGFKMREKREGSEVSSRPTSLIEGSTALVSLQQDSQYMTSPLSPSSTSTDSRDDLLDSSESSLSRTGSKEVLDAFSKPCIIGTSGTPKMSEIMRAFERHDMNSKGSVFGGSHPRMSSLDSTASDDCYQGAHYGSVSSLASGQRDQYGSITSLSSSTSIISPQELAQLIEEANHSLEESGTPSHEILVVVLHREIVGHGSIGITLAGGADYETKEITVHKVIPGSLADRDGRIQKGDRILSINGKTLRGVSHREALNILKSPRPEVVLVLSRSRSVTPQENTVTSFNGDLEMGFSHRPVFVNHVPPPRPPKILESPMDSKSLVSDSPCDSVPRGPPLTITLVKDGAGLGFSLEGGKDSPLGDRPLIVKKIFSGGAADKGGILVVGDELLSINNVDLTHMARIEAWNFLKKLNDGTVSLVIRKKLPEAV